MYNYYLLTFSQFFLNTKNTRDLNQNQFYMIVAQGLTGINVENIFITYSKFNITFMTIPYKRKELAFTYEFLQK